MDIEVFFLKKLFHNFTLCKRKEKDSVLTISRVHWMCSFFAVNEQIENTEEQRKVSLLSGSFHHFCW